ncbi:MAG: ParB domain protein nuclease [Candidatus Falkowbacteria bacterium GW2011_GWA2_39_24]|uniref:Methyltransferase n=1 Tax=Candidatus Falkowbacteria bacterium GW2011_GWA2_39_24 TaxID=1618634 RepID=A0A0G0NH41_9BACT|nr:MAG: ParB domain protein nuclease [Candidatus Falkowbacteria bacterium GW2011_GWA2_39_24]
MNNSNIKIVEVPINELKMAEYNPRKHSKEQSEQLKESIKKFGMVDPVICNSAPERNNIIIGGHFRVEVAKELGMTTVPVVYVQITDIAKEKELNLRLNKNVGEFDLDLLAQFDESFLTDIGFDSQELDNIFPIEENAEQFDLKKELEKLNIKTITVQKGDVYELNGSRLLCGDSTSESDILKLMNGEKADMCFTDPPYMLDYLHTKYKGKGSGFGFKRNRRYLGTDTLPIDFTEKWAANIHKIQKEDFSIICFENWKNIRTVWGEIEKYWRVNNMIVWHLPNRTQGFAAKYRFFSKHDIAMVGTSENKELNAEEESELLQNEYETALYAIGGKPQWEGYEAGKKICPTDFIEFKADDAKHSGQGIVFGCKPIEILIPYIKVLTKRNDLIVEPFGGSGSTLMAAIRMNRRCFVMEKSPVYTEVILKRWEKESGKRPIKVM